MADAHSPVPVPDLRTPRLRLRPVDERDEQPLFELHSNPRVMRYWDSPPWTDPARAARFVVACRHMAEAGTGARVAVDHASDDTLLGWCGLVEWDHNHRSATLGYCFTEPAWGHGYATESARALLTWGFDTLDLNRVQAEVDTRHRASARVLQKLGFEREGTLREDCIVDGEVSDTWVFGLLRRDFPALTGR